MNLVTIIALFTYSTATLLASKILSDDNEDAHLTVPELITKYGYPAEEHFVTTSDGYILRLHRIPRGKNATVPSTNVVFLMHCILCSSADWIITGPNHALGYLLADAGYDVWMGNGRGNHESRNHTTLNPDTDDEFWKFSWHEIGAIDLPSMVDYALNATGQSQLVHIGHSQGTTTFYVMLSVLPEYNDKIKAHFSLAPIAFMNHMTSPLMRIMAFWSSYLSILFRLIGINEFLPSNNFIASVGNALCSDQDITQSLCTNALFAICGFSPNEINTTILPVLTGHTPAGCSVMQLVHYAQEVNSGAFREYDFGSDNLEHYGSRIPPDYNLSQITAPTYLYFSRNDWMAAEKDVSRLCDEIGTACEEMILVADGKFNHLDYLYGINAREFVYKPMMKIIKSV